MADTWRTGTKNRLALYKNDQPAGFISNAVDAMELTALASAVAHMPHGWTLARTDTLTASEKLDYGASVLQLGDHQYMVVPFMTAAGFELKRRETEG